MSYSPSEGIGDPEPEAPEGRESIEERSEYGPEERVERGGDGGVGGSEGGVGGMVRLGNLVCGMIRRGEGISAVAKCFGGLGRRTRADLGVLLGIHFWEQKQVEKAVRCMG